MDRATVKSSKKKNIFKTKNLTHSNSSRLPNVVLLGSKRLRSSLVILETLYSIFVKQSSLDLLEGHIDRFTISIIIDENFIKKSPHLIVQKLSTKYPLIPIIYLSRSKQRDNFFERLYIAGARAIINWPKEKNILPELILESLKPHPKATGHRKKDESLARIVKSHILLNNGPKNIKVFNVEGFVFLRGKVKTLWQAKAIRDLSSSVLGVKKVIAKDLVVMKSKSVSKKEIERKIKIFISNLLGKQKRSIGVRIRDRVAYIEGHILSSVSLHLIKKFIMNQPNVDMISTNVVLDDNRAVKKSNQAKKLENKLLDLFDGLKKVSLRILGDTIEISGTLTDPGTQRLLEDYILQRMPVKNIVNKTVIISS